VKNPDSNQKVYLTGNTEKLGDWNPNTVELENVSDQEWSKIISLNEGEKIQFKITAES
jgi:hypothetical protein